MDATERRQRAAAEAVEWWVQLREEELPRADRERFIDWLRESAVHVAEMLRIAQTHDALDKFEHWTRIATGGASRERNVVDFPRDAVTGGATRHRGRKRTWGVAMAASIALCALAAWLFAIAGAGVIETARGERREVALGDGTSVHVDPQTLLRVDFDEQARRIVLKRGRAVFKVAAHPHRPFTVEAGDTVVRALGTSFGVERQQQAVVVTVAEGKVAVTSGGNSAIPILTANQQATLSAAAPAVRQVDSASALAWVQGRLIFENDAVAKVVEQFNRYNQVQLAVADAALASRQVSGVFDAADPESFIAFIRTVARVRIVRDREEVITIASAPM